MIMSKKLQMDNFDNVKMIGTGGFSNVHVMKHKTTNYVVAKEIDLDLIHTGVLTPSQLYQELGNHSTCLHNNIVRMFGYLHEEGKSSSFLNIITAKISSQNCTVFMAM